MDKKITSWGVSFGSLALVAGMVSYLGLTNNGKTNAANKLSQAQTNTQQPTQLDQNNRFNQPAKDSSDQALNQNQPPSFTDDSNSFSDEESSFDGSQGFDRHNNSFQQHGSSFSHDGSSVGGHSRQFDTTTGGT